MEMKALEDVFLHELAELNDVEQQLVKALPKMAKAANSSALKSAFETHYKQTQRHAERLEKIFKALGRDTTTRDSDPISDIIKQGETVIAMKTMEPEVLDAALIATAQKAEHYEIATYGAARSHARTLGYSKVSDVLEDTLEEEEQTDALLTQIATKRVNREAAKAPFARARTAPRGGESDGGIGFGGLFAGLLIGAAVALLYAPKSGERMRKDLRDAADDLKQRGDEWRSSAEDLIERGKQTISEQRNRFASQS
jgi:ferritin-like metal-binding protein YciE